MKIDFALPDTASPTTFALARVSEPLRCPVLGEPLQRAASRLIAGLPVVLVYQDPHGEIRAYGRADLVAAAAGLDLDRQLRAPFELPDAPKGDAIDPFDELAA